jgi:hypothetical protein
MKFNISQPYDVGKETSSEHEYRNYELIREDEKVQLKIYNSQNKRYGISISYSHASENDKCKFTESLAKYGINEEWFAKYELIPASHQYHARFDQSICMLGLSNEIAWNIITKLLDVIEEIEGKGSLQEARDRLEELKPRYQLTQTLFKVQSEIDSGNQKLMTDANKYLPADLKEKLKIEDDIPFEAKKDFSPDKGRTAPISCNVM